MTAMTSPLTGTPLEILRKSVAVVTGAMMNVTGFSIRWKKPKIFAKGIGSSRFPGVLVEVVDGCLNFPKTPSQILERRGTREICQIKTTRESSMPSENRLSYGDRERIELPVP